MRYSDSISQTILLEGFVETGILDLDKELIEYHSDVRCPKGQIRC